MAGIYECIHLKSLQSCNADRCVKHCIPKDYWCIVCKEPGCADCFILGSDHVGHQLAKSISVFKTLMNEYKTKQIKSYDDQRKYWIRYRDDLLRQLSEFGLECLQKRSNEEELFNCFMEADQLMEQDINHYYECSLKKAEAKIILYTKALESGEAFLNELPITAVLQDSQKYFLQAQSRVKEICDDAENTDKELSDGEIRDLQSLKYQCITPEYDCATFMITDFNRFRSRGEIKLSPVTRFSGSLWRLKVYTFESEKTNSFYLSVFVELFQGLPGEYDYKFQLKESTVEFSAIPSFSKIYKSQFKEGECWGYQKFIKLDNRFNQLYYNHSNDSISLMYSIRPTTYYQKCLNLQNYIAEMELKSKNFGLDNTTDGEVDPSVNVAESKSDLLNRPCIDMAYVQETPAVSAKKPVVSQFPVPIDDRTGNITPIFASSTIESIRGTLNESPDQTKMERFQQNEKEQKLFENQGLRELLVIKNLDATADDEKLRREFSNYGVITFAKVMLNDETGASRGIGFVCFSSTDEATKAVNAMNGKMVAGKFIDVGFAFSLSPSDAARILERESQITLTDYPSECLPHISEIEIKTDLESLSSSSSLNESSNETVNTILSRLRSKKLEQNPSISKEE